MAAKNTPTREVKKPSKATKAKQAKKTVVKKGKGY